MNISETSMPLEEGLRIPAADILPPADTVSGMVEIAGMPMHKDIALVIIAAGCFFIGVIISCMMPDASSEHRRRTLLSAPMSFFLTAPIWFTLLSGDLIETSIPPIDSFIEFSMGTGGVRAQMFAFGVVMVLGMLAAPILAMVTGLMNKAMRFGQGGSDGPGGAPNANGANG